MNAIDSAALIFFGLFPIINPPGTALIFYSMTRETTHEKRAEIAKRVVLYSFIIITASLYFGAYVLQIFGVSIPVLRVAGGIVVSLTGWNLLNAPQEEPDVARPARNTDLLKASFYPLTMPLTTGPGTIAVTIALGAGRPDQILSFVIGASIATLLIAAILYVCFRYADRVETTLGATASDAVARLFAFILMCIGIETLWSGISELVAQLPR